MLKEKAGVIAGKIWESLNGSEGKNPKTNQKRNQTESRQRLIFRLRLVIERRQD